MCLLFVTLFSEIQIRSVLVAGQQLFNSLEDRSFNKDNKLFDDRDDGVIIIAAFRRLGGTYRGKYNKAIDTTTRKVVKVSTTAASTTTTAAPTTTTAASTTTRVSTTRRTTSASTTTTEAIEFTPEEVIKVTTAGTVSLAKDIRRNQLARQDRQNSLWAARKRVTRPPIAYVQKKKALKVNIEDEEEYSVRRARYLFTQRTGRK